MKRYLILALAIIALVLMPAQTVEATSCGSLSNYNLPGIIARIKHNASGECFVAWFEKPDEVASFIEKGTFATPRLAIDTMAGYYNGHNAGYSWVTDKARFVDGTPLHNHKPSELEAGSTAIMDVTVLYWVDNRIHDMDFGGTVGKIDVADIMNVVTGYPSQPGDSGYKQGYDLVYNGSIDMFDIHAIADRWNQTFTPLKIVSTWTPSSCSAWYVRDIQVSFVNNSGADRTFWVEKQIDGVWYRGEGLISVPNGAGGVAAAFSFDAPSSVRLKAANTSLSGINNISWSRTCIHAPPVVMSVTGLDQIMPPDAVSKAQSSGTYFTASSVDNMPAILTQEDLDAMGLTEAQYESQTGRTAHVVPKLSLQQTAHIMQDGEWWVSTGWFEINEVMGWSFAWDSFAFAFQWGFGDGWPVQPLHIEGYVYKIVGTTSQLIWQEQDSGWNWVEVDGNGTPESNRMYCFEWAASLGGQFIGVPPGGPPNIKCEFAQ